MSDPIIAVKDAQTIISEALAAYKAATVSAANPGGVTLAQADPRRLHLLALLSIVTQLRADIDFAGKQSLLRFVSDLWIDELAALWTESRLQAAGSEALQRFEFPLAAPTGVPIGTRVTDGNLEWEVVRFDAEDLTGAGNNGIPYSDWLVRCTTAGLATNGVAIGQIDTIVDPDAVPGLIQTYNLNVTDDGRDLETVDEFRERLRDIPESRSTAGPRVAYEAIAREADTSVADAVALGPEDGPYVASYAPNPGEVYLLILQGERNKQGVLTSVVPEPEPQLIETVQQAASAETERPLTDFLTTMAPAFVEFDLVVTYYIGRDRQDSASEIQAAAQEALDDYLLWQQSKIGRDINPDNFRTRLLNAGAKRTVVTEPAFTALMRDQSARANYVALIYGGVEDE